MPTPGYNAASPPGIPGPTRSAGPGIVPGVDTAEARRRFARARVARLATVRPGGGPHLVPVVFALEGETVWLVVDEKPKRRRRLQRLANIEADPRASLLVDAYDEDWGALWWVRADGRARIVAAGPELELAQGLLAAKYPQYRDRPPPGPAVAVEVTRWASWSAASGSSKRPASATGILSPPRRGPPRP